MHVVVALAVALVAVLLLIFLAGLTPFLAIPIFVVAVGLAALWAAVARRMSERHLETDAPSTSEASYDPVVDPAERR